MQHLVRRLIIVDVGLILPVLGLIIMISRAEWYNLGLIHHGQRSVLQMVAANVMLVGG